MAHFQPSRSLRSDTLSEAALKAMSKPHLLGKDPCYGLMRRMYEACGIELPDFERGPEEGRNEAMLSAIDEFASCFVETTGDPLLPGDVIVWTDRIQHIAVVIGDGFAASAGDSTGVTTNRADRFLRRPGTRTMRYVG